jgi:tetratricopeptide (TPR) repeat protein
VADGEYTMRDEPEDVSDATKREGPGDRARLAHVGTKDVDIESVPDGPDVERLERGTNVGRYIVIDVLGEGGMGVVYSAYDPELDRKVAIKLLQARPGASRGTGSSGTDQAWLLREAQAMARLSHPNVIAVHDVGMVDMAGPRVWVAMEQVDGVTLRVWLRDKVRPWREVVPVMLEAGAGLGAAHASGLVHRDFKPDNVLVGNDGRVRVMDFGLARLRPEDEGGPPDRQSDASIEARSPLSTPLTMAGTVIGTPAYMAPEIGDGILADARSDQFSFGVALYEALYRARPFAKDTPRTRPKPPPTNNIPERVQRVVLRAMAADPQARYASMTELLEDLARASAPRRRPWIVAGAVLGLAGAAVAGFAISKSSEPAAAPVENQLCKGAERRLAGIWDDQTRAATQKAFDKSTKPFKAKSFEALARALNAYATKWTAAATDACEATRLRGEQTEEVLSLRQSCLDQRLYELGALVQVLGDADDKMVEAGDKLVVAFESQDPIARCANVAALRAPGLPPTEPRDKVEELRRLLAGSKAELIAGRHFGSMEAARKAGTIAAEIKYEPYRAEALLVRGASLAGIGNTTEANQVFTDAVWAALAANRHDLVTMAAMTNAAVVSEGKVGEAQIWLGLARTSAGRVGSDSQLEQRLLQVEGLIAAKQGDVQAAVAAQTKALAIAERAMGPTNPALWSDLEVMGVTLARSGAWAKARPVLERAMALRESSVGSDHPDIAAVLTNLGAAYSNLNEPDKARAAYERALSIRERADGPRNPMLILTLNNMADAMTKAKDHQNALHYVERGKLLAEKLGKSAAMYHAISTTHAEALHAVGRTKEALEVYKEVLALEEEHKSQFFAHTLASRAAIALEAKKWAEAIEYESRSIGVFEASSGKETPDLFKPLVGMAQAKLGQGKPAEARPFLERALAIGEKSQLGPTDMDPVRKLLEQARK